MRRSDIVLNFFFKKNNRRFITHLPEDELNSLERIGFHIEEAHWFYEDFSREQNSNLPAWNLKEFAFQSLLNVFFLIKR